MYAPNAGMQAYIDTSGTYISSFWAYIDDSEWCIAASGTDTGGFQHCTDVSDGYGRAF